MHTESTHASVKKMSAGPIVVVVTALSLLSWLLLHNFHHRGNMWADDTKAAPHAMEKPVHGHE